MSLTHKQNYHLAVVISTASMLFGILREFLIVGLLGFTKANDQLQLPLSIFYTIGLSIDAIRLSCLNLYIILPLSQILFAATVIALPFAIIVGLAFNFSTHGIATNILWIAIIGSYFNLMAALLITYKQRNNFFLSAQIINVLPNFILIPGVLFCYFIQSKYIIITLVTLTSVIPVLQCLALLILPTQAIEFASERKVSLLNSITVFLSHFSAVSGEQAYQLIVRSAFYHFAAGYLSLFAITIRLYSALRFIFIDSFIGSKLAAWQTDEKSFLGKVLTSKGIVLNLILILSVLFITFWQSNLLFISSIQMLLILVSGFYLSTCVRIIYFKINRHETNKKLITQFALFEIVTAFLAFMLTQQSNYPLLSLIWVGYTLKPFAQLIMLKERFLYIIFSEKDVILRG